MLDPLTIEQAERHAGEGPLVVALSGGGDSVALLHLLAEHCGVGALHALIVDHALREGSSLDALRARRLASQCGVGADVLTVQWPRGVKRSQAAARAARYDALCDAARERGARVIVAAHTADDQMETVFMRAAAGSAWRGLAGMAPFAPAPVWPSGRGLWLARPLLGTRRSVLRALLQARGADWIEDPANNNAAYQRVRIRARLAALETEGAEVMRLARLADRLRPHVGHLDAQAAALIESAAAFRNGVITLAPATADAPPHVRRRLVSVLIAATSGEAREPIAAAVERLDRRMWSAEFGGACLGGARIARGRQGLHFDRDPGALTGRAGGVVALAPMPLEAGRETVWDGRLALRMPEPGWMVCATSEGAELRRGGARRRIEALAERGAARWLLRARIAHLLRKFD